MRLGVRTDFKQYVDLALLRRTMTRRRLRGDWIGWALLLIIFVASALRLARLEHIPPGLHVDEASNAWNASTLLKTRKAAP